MSRKVKIDLEPRRQFAKYIQRNKRWACIVAHRRAGKTFACIQDLILKAGQCRKPDPRFAYIAPTYSQAKDVAWHYLKQNTAAIPDIITSENELSITLPHNNARIRLYGANEYDRLRGLYLDGCVIDETGDIDPRAWPEVIRPALSDRTGWATFIGTPKGRNGFYKVYQAARKNADWFVAKLKASETGLIPDRELEDARRSMTPEQYRQEYECSFDAAILGAYYAADVELAEVEKRVCRVHQDQSADVYAAWDLGIGDSTAIWVFQIVGKEWHWLHFYENSGKPLGHYVDWIKALPFAVHTHFLPHDAEARELQTGKNRLEFLEGRELNCEIVPRGNVDDGINAVRTRFNRFYFDEDRCALGLECLRMYKADYDHKRMVLKNKPLHDWTSHGADALRTGVMGADEYQDAIDYEYFEQPDTSWVC